MLINNRQPTMKHYKVHFTVRGILTTFAEVIDAEAVDYTAFRTILNERMKAEGFISTVDNIFFITES